jgi:hypothetical protein
LKCLVLFESDFKNMSRPCATSTVIPIEQFICPSSSQRSKWHQNSHRNRISQTHFISSEAACRTFDHFSENFLRLIFLYYKEALSRCSSLFVSFTMRRNITIYKGVFILARSPGGGANSLSLMWFPQCIGMNFSPPIC